MTVKLMDFFFSAVHNNYN